MFPYFSERLLRRKIPKRDHHYDRKHILHSSLPWLMEYQAGKAQEILFRENHWSQEYRPTRKHKEKSEIKKIILADT